MLIILVFEYEFDFKLTDRESQRIGPGIGQILDQDTLILSSLFQQTRKSVDPCSTIGRSLPRIIAFSQIFQKREILNQPSLMKVVRKIKNCWKQPQLMEILQNSKNQARSASNSIMLDLAKDRNHVSIVKVECYHRRKQLSCRIS